LLQNKDDLKTPVNIIVSRASSTAIAAVEKAGGQIQTRFYTKQSLGRVRKGLTDPILSLQSQEIQSLLAPLTSDQTAVDDANVKKAAELLNKYQYRLPDPTSRKDIEYYRDPAKRGYMAYQLKEGEGPSLFFRTPFQKRPATGKKVKQKAAENRVW
jgi:large subunit ribosomal protein L15